MTDKIVKVGILLSILALPAFAFLFLKTFGQNEFKLEVFNPFTAECDNRSLEDSVHRIPDFSFTSEQGKTITQADFAGKIYVADFFFSTCPDICKLMANQLVRVQDAYSENPDVRILSHTANPSYDKPEILKEYGSRYDAKSPFWTFATGEKAEILRMAKCGYFIPVVDNDDPEQAIIHSERFVLVDKEGRIRGFYDGTKAEEVDRLITEIAVLLGNYQ